MTADRRLGIIAGAGDLPVRLAAAAAAAGRDPFVVTLRGAAMPADFQPWPHAAVEMAQVGRVLSALRQAGCADIVMAGRLQRPSFSRLKPDWQGIRLLPRVVAAAREGDDALLRALVRFFEDEGFRVVGAEEVLGDLLAPLGPLGRLEPGPEEWHDIGRAVQVVQALGALDVGQAAIVRDGLVLGVEAAEGTDALIERCRLLQTEGSGGVLVKLPKPGQERRVDLPTIGRATVARAAAARLKGIALAAGGALVLDRNDVAAAADVAGIFVCGIDLAAGVPGHEPP